jgi:hypothetical protein
MNANRHNKCPHLGRRTLISAAAALAIVGLGPQLNFVEQAKADEPKPMLMFVQIADDLKVDPAANTLRLVNVSKQTLYFSDRPVRLAGHLKMADYLEEWTKQAGSDSFRNDPPNATLSVYEPGQADNTLAVVELTNPVIDGADLVYTYKLIDGKMPKAGGATSLFIDWIGLGGGVGVGFHGVGVGLRGPGVL